MRPEDIERLKALSRKALDDMSRSADFAHSIFSRGLQDKRAPDDVIRDRHVSCFGREPFSLVQLQSPCPALSRSPTGDHHCEECGCPKERNTAMDVRSDGYSKLHYPWLACPRKKKGFSNHEPP